MRLTPAIATPAQAALRIRRVRPNDRPALQAFFGRLSPRTVQARYLGAWTSLSGPLLERELQRVLVRDPVRHVVLLAVEGTQIRGVGEFAVDEQQQAELGVTVEDAYQRRGIGSRLLEALEKQARVRGVAAFVGDVGYDNAASRALLRGSGHELHLRPDRGSQRFRLALDDLPQCAPTRAA